MSIQRASRAALAVLLVAGAAGAAAAPAPVARYADDQLTVHMSRTPVAECVKALESATGATVRGRVPTDGEVSVDLDGVPLAEGLGRIFGERNFAITYRDDGRPSAIELLGAPLPAAAPRAAANAAPPAAAPAGPAGWPADPETARAVTTLQSFLERNPSIPLDDTLARALGTKTSTFRDVLKLAATSDDRRVRSRAGTAALRVLHDDATTWQAFEAVVTTAPVEGMRDFARHQMGPHAEDLARQVMAQGNAPTRSQMRAVLRALGEQPPEVARRAPAP